MKGKATGKLDIHDWLVSKGIIKFSFAKRVGHRTFESLDYFVSCRSYMTDVLFNIRNPNYPSPPPFKYTYNPDSKEDTYLFIMFDAVIDYKQFLNNVEFIHNYERKAGVKLSKFYDCSTPENPRLIMVQGSRYWKDSCWKLSLWSYILKCTSIKNIHLNFHFEEKKLDHILTQVKHKKDIFCESVYGKGIIFGRHSSEGFVSVITGGNKPMAQHLGLTQ